MGDETYLELVRENAVLATHVENLAAAADKMARVADEQAIQITRLQEQVKTLLKARNRGISLWQGVAIAFFGPLAAGLSLALLIWIAEKAVGATP